MTAQSFEGVLKPAATAEALTLEPGTPLTMHALASTTGSGLVQKTSSAPLIRSSDSAALAGDALRKKKVREAYSVIRKYTGALGGNGTGGPIYGEITERYEFYCAKLRMFVWSPLGCTC